MGRIRRTLRGFSSTQEEVRRKVWQRWNNPSGRTTPVFLIGCGRSGTSMVVSHLARSWRTELYNEDNPAAFDKWRIRDLQVIQGLVERSFAELVLFKPILHTYQIRSFLTRFPDSKAIFAFRHYDDVINSSIKRFGLSNRINHVRVWIEEDFGEFADSPPPAATKDFIRANWDPSMNPETGAALYWLFQNRLFFDLGLHEDQAVKLVHYESIVRGPTEKFRVLCQFLGLTYEPKISEGIYHSSVKRDPPPEIDPGIRAACEDQRLALIGRAL